mmetsp:Transcript_4441/g.4999  ORF Transcript_4441/g.4999 Transcript_4441/m.4999 type:complete len:122 (-) Transcript_4441:128-493(-)
MGHSCSKSHSIPPVKFPEGTSREEMMKQVFMAVDDNKSGKLSKEEFEQLATNSGDAEAKALLDEVFEHMDKGKFFSLGKDGQISLEEFVEYQVKAGKGTSDEDFSNQAGMWLALGQARAVK